MQKHSWKLMALTAGSIGTLATVLVPMTAQADTQPVTIKLAMASGEITPQEVAAFNKVNPGIKVDLVTYDASALPAQFASGSAPDIIRTTGSSLPADVEKGLAMDIQPYINKDKAVFNPNNFNPVANAYRWNGKVQGQGDLYGLPKDWSPDFSIWINKQVFKSAHIPLPSESKPMTWPQVFAISKKLTKTDSKGKITQYGLGYYAGSTQAEASMVTFQAAEQHVDVWSKDYSKAQFENPKVVAILNQWNTAVKQNLGPNVVNKDVNWAGTLFTSNKMGMIVSGYWFSGMVRSSDPKLQKQENNFYMVPAPTYAHGVRMDPPSSATGAYIWTGTKHPDEAWKVFEYFFGKQPANDRAETGWGLPIFKTKMGLVPQKTAWDKNVLKVAQTELKYSGKLLTANPYVDLDTVNTIITKYMTPVYYGKDTVQDAAKQIDNTLDGLIQAGMQEAQG